MKAVYDGKEGRIVAYVGLVNQTYAVVKIGDKLEQVSIKHITIKEEAYVERMAASHESGASGNTGTDGQTGDGVSGSKARVRKAKA